VKLSGAQRAWDLAARISAAANGARPLKNAQWYISGMNKGGKDSRAQALPNQMHLNDGPARACEKSNAQ
jgi:hypothetical protein